MFCWREMLHGIPITAVICRFLEPDMEFSCENCGGTAIIVYQECSDNFALSWESTA